MRGYIVKYNPYFLCLTKYQYNYLKNKITLQKYTMFISSAHKIHNIILTLSQKKLYGNRCRSNDPSTIN